MRFRLRLPFVVAVAALLFHVPPAHAHGDNPSTCVALAKTYLKSLVVRARGLETMVELDARPTIVATHAVGYGAEVTIATDEVAAQVRTLWFDQNAFGFGSGRCVVLPAGQRETTIVFELVLWSAGTSGMLQNVVFWTLEDVEGLGYTVDWR